MYTIADSSVPPCQQFFVGEEALALLENCRHEQARAHKSKKTRRVKTWELEDLKAIVLPCFPVPTVCVSGGFKFFKVVEITGGQQKRIIVFYTEDKDREVISYGIFKKEDGCFEPIRRGTKIERTTAKYEARMQK